MRLDPIITAVDAHAGGEPGRVIEWFLVESWAEHLRQHHRVSKADADLQADALRFHQEPERPVVHHFLALTPGGADGEGVAPSPTALHPH